MGVGGLKGLLCCTHDWHVTVGTKGRMIGTAATGARAAHALWIAVMVRTGCRPESVGGQPIPVTVAHLEAL